MLQAVRYTGTIVTIVGCLLSISRSTHAETTLKGILRFEMGQPVPGYYVFALDLEGNVLGYAKTYEDLQRGPNLGKWELKGLPSTGKIELVAFHPNDRTFFGSTVVEVRGKPKTIYDLELGHISRGVPYILPGGSPVLEALALGLKVLAEVDAVKRQSAIDRLREKPSEHIEADKSKIDSQPLQSSGKLAGRFRENELRTWKQAFNEPPQSVDVSGPKSASMIVADYLKDLDVKVEDFSRDLQRSWNQVDAARVDKMAELGRNFLWIEQTLALANVVREVYGPIASLNAHARALRQAARLRGQIMAKAKARGVDTTGLFQGLKNGKIYNSGSAWAKDVAKGGSTVQQGLNNTGPIGLSQKGMETAPSLFTSSSTTSSPTGTTTQSFLKPNCIYYQRWVNTPISDPFGGQIFAGYYVLDWKCSP